MQLTPSAVEALRHYSWPGNIRELDNTIARAVVLSPNNSIEPKLLALPTHEQPHGSADTHPDGYLDLPYHESMEQHSRMLILRALRFANGNQTKAAERLRLQRTYLGRLIRQKDLSAR